MPTPNIADVVKFTQATILNAFNEARQASPFEGLVMRKKAPEGIAQFSVSIVPAAFKLFTGEAIPVGVDAANLSVLTKQYKNPVEIDWKQMRNAGAMVGDEEFQRPFKMLGKDATFAEDAALTALLEANSNDILGSAYFGSARTIKNSAQTLTNTQAGTGTSVAQIRADFFTAKKLLVDMKNAAGRPYHGSGVRAQKPIVMYPPALHAAMLEVFEAERNADGSTNITYKAAILRENPYLTDANDWFLLNSSPAYPALLLAHDYDSPVLMHDGTGGTEGGQGSRDRILRNKVLFNADWDFEVAFGSPFEIIRTANT